MRNKNLLFALIAVVACGLIAAGCGGDDETTTVEDAQEQLEDVQVPTDADEALENAQEQLEDAPENIDEAVQQCLDNVESSGLPDDQKDGLRDLCEAGGNAAQDAIDNAEGITP
ncbi:MAG TPA: hypothetical protein VKA36_09925 [Solirubrobacterales bacterium]|nr:hypothetical protein [Solirubrobacterales bacterium]